MNEASVVDRMKDLIDAWDVVPDRRSIFLTCYWMMTRNMLLAVEAGEFEDGVWVSALLYRFADYYFNALEAYERGTSYAPAVWSLTFETAGRAHVHVLQNLFLGVNAHICYDLVFVLVDMLKTEWPDLSDAQRQSRYRDHRHVNDIIHQTIDRVQDEVIERYSPAMDVVDKLFGPLDEWAIYRLIANWREHVWNYAAALIACTDDSESQVLHQEVEQHALNQAHSILGERGLPGLLELL